MLTIIDYWDTVAFTSAPKQRQSIRSIMLYIALTMTVILIIYGPSLYIHYVIWKHSKELPNMPGTGGELAEHLVERFALQGVEVVEGLERQDHYNPEKNIISLSPSVYGKKSLAAVAIAAHELGHALQFNRQEPVSQLRGKYLSKAFKIKRLGMIILMSIPLVTIAFKVPSIALVTAGVGVITMLASVMMYVAILPEEFDASFNKALPILAEGYVPNQDLPAIKQVLRAAALTYVAAALADTLSLWRWIRVFR